jgi:threonine dehydratase
MWPISWQQVQAAEQRIRPFIEPTPLRRYPALDRAVQHDIALWLKHDNYCPTNSFKARNGMAFVTALGHDQRARGVIAASRGNHGQGLAWAGALLGAPVTICVPEGNNPDKNLAMRDFGARLVERGADYDESLAVALELARRDGAVLAHSTDEPEVIAGAATLAVEIVRAQPELDAMVIAVGGGSQAVGALTVARALRPDLKIYGVQAEGAAAIHDSWHAGRPLARDRALTLADGLATRSCYELTFPALHHGLAGFVTVTDAEIADAVRLIVEATHNLVEPAGAAGLAGARKLAPVLAGQRVAIVLSGSNIDSDTLRRIMTRQL